MDAAVFFLVLFPLSVFSQTLQESGPGIVKPSEQLKSTCTAFGFEVNSYYMSWVRQLDGKGLQWIGFIRPDGTTALTDSLKSRVTITRDVGKKQVYLQMSQMVVQDSGIYYCARDRYFDVWGPGTTVTVSSELKLTPAVFPMISAGHKDSNFVSFGCLASKYFPQPVTTTWKTITGQVPSNINNFPAIEFRDPFSYSLFSQVTVSKTEWSSNTYQCTVKHFSSSIQKNVTNDCDTPPQSPSVYLMQGTCPESSYGQVELTCQVYNLTTQNAQVKWFINNQERQLQQELHEFGKSKTDYWVLSSTVSISQAEWNNGVQVKCHVTDENTKKSAEDTIRKCSDNINCLGINVFMVPPSVENLYVHKTAPIKCVATNLKDTNGFTFDWSYPGAPTPEFQTEDPLLNDNGTFSVFTNLIVTPEAWNQNTEFTCKFRHPELSTPILATISKSKDGKNSPPTVALYPPSSEDLEKKEIYTLVAAAYNHWPNDIYISWLKNDQEISIHEYVTIDSKTYPGGQNYVTFSIVTIPATSWEKGDVYTCIVGHEASPMIFTRRSIDKNSGKPTVVNVSVTMSDSTLSCH